MRQISIGDCQSVSEQIAAIIGGHCPAEEIDREIGEYTPENLKYRGSDLVSRLHDSQAHLSQLHLRRGEINQEMKSLGENRRLASARFELGCVRQQLDDAAREWRVVSTTWHLLEHVRVTYEAERQPETLDEASLYLERLTNGKYTRVWTPLGRHELRVDDTESKPLPLDVLSRGTREAVFLSLRLALVSSYGRRGINIPMVLDDVLVNLDAQRAESAVALLCDFARQGRQLLFFTCHDHIRAMFQRANVDVRVIPAHGTPGTRISRPEMPAPMAVPAEPEPADEELAWRDPLDDPAAEASDSVEETLEAADAAEPLLAEEPWAEDEPAAEDHAADDELLTLIAAPDGEPEDELLPTAAASAPSWELPELVRDDEYGLQDAVDRPTIPGLFPLDEIESDEEPPPEVEDWRDDEFGFEDSATTEPIDEVFAVASEGRLATDGLWWDVGQYSWATEEETALN